MHYPPDEFEHLTLEVQSKEVKADKIDINLSCELKVGDCLLHLKSIKDNSIDLIVTDPPYEINNTTAGGSSKLCGRIQSMNDEIDNLDIVNGFDLKILDELVRINKNINMYFFCNKAQLPMYFDYFVTGLGCSFDLIKWVKTNSMPTYNNKYLSDTEYCFYARKGGYCNPETYEDASTLYQSPLNKDDKKHYKHPTIKPINLIEKLIRNSIKVEIKFLPNF